MGERHRAAAENADPVSPATGAAALTVMMLACDPQAQSSSMYCAVMSTESKEEVQPGLHCTTLAVPDAHQWDIVAGLELVLRIPSGGCCTTADALSLLHSVTVMVDGTRMDGWVGAMPVHQLQLCLARCRAQIFTASDGTAFVPLLLCPFQCGKGEATYWPLLANQRVQIQVTCRAAQVSAEVWGWGITLVQRMREMLYYRNPPHVFHPDTVPALQVFPPVPLHTSKGCLSLLELAKQGSAAAASTPFYALNIVGLEWQGLQSITLTLNGCSHTWQAAHLQRQQALHGFNQVQGVTLFFEEDCDLIRHCSKSALLLERFNTAKLTISTSQVGALLQLFGLRSAHHTIVGGVNM